MPSGSARRALATKGPRERREMLLKGAARGGLHEQLGALEAGAPRDDVRDRIIDAYLGRPARPRGGIAKN